MYLIKTSLAKSIFISLVPWLIRATSIYGYSFILGMLTVIISRDSPQCTSMRKNETVGIFKLRLVNFHHSQSLYDVDLISYIPNSVIHHVLFIQITCLQISDSSSTNLNSQVWWCRILLPLSTMLWIAEMVIFKVLVCFSATQMNWNRLDSWFKQWRLMAAILAGFIRSSC